MLSVYTYVLMHDYSVQTAVTCESSFKHECLQITYLTAHISIQVPTCLEYHQVRVCAISFADTLVAIVRIRVTYLFKAALWAVYVTHNEVVVPL